MTPTRYTRAATFDASRAAGDHIPVVVSTTEPVDRGGRAEILSHDPRDVDMSRAPLPLLVSHDHRQLPIGVVEDLQLDGNKLRGKARFSDNPTAQSIKADVMDGILRSVSVGYSLTKALRETAGEVMYAWMPFEVSVVSVPADRNAGFFRSEITMEDNELNESNNDQRPSRSQRRALNRSEEQFRIADLERRERIRAIGDAYAKYLRPNDAADAAQRGDSVEQFQEFILSRMQSSHTPVGDRIYGGSDFDEWDGMAKKYSIGRAIRNMLDPGNRHGGLEREMSEEIGRRLGRRPAPGGFFAPDDFLFQSRGVAIGTTSTGGGALHVGQFHGELFADAFRAQTIVGALGARLFTGQTSDLIIPRKTATSTMGWATETGTASESTPDFDQLTLKPKRITTFVKVSQQALIQSGLALENLIRDDLVSGMMVEIDRVALRGAGTGSEPTGLLVASGLGTVTGGTSGAQITYGHLVDLEKACANSNAKVGQSGFAVNPNTRAYLKKTPKISGSVTDLAWNDAALSPDGIGIVCGHRAGVTTNLRSNLTKGTSTTVCSELLFGSDWSELAVARFGGNEVIVDPYSLAKTGEVQVTLNGFVDVGVRRAAAFAKMTDALTS